MDPRREYRVRECRQWQERIEQELARLREEDESKLQQQLAKISELAYELELNFPYDEERHVVLYIPTISRLIEAAWFGEVLVDEERDVFIPLAGITYANPLNKSWGHFIIRRRIMWESKKRLQTGAYLVPAGKFKAAVFPKWKTETLRRILIPECPLLPIMSYDEYIRKLWQEISGHQTPSRH